MSDALLAGLTAISEAAGDAPEQQLIAAKCRGLLLAYEQRWGEPDFEILSVENTVTSELWNPTTKAKSRTFTIAGKLDLTAMRNGNRVLFDHKTTSDDIEDPAGPYWRQLIIEAQPSHYALLEWLNGRKVDEITWDVMRKPGISPKQLTKADQLQIGKDGVYFGGVLVREEIDEARSTGRETLRMYEYRLAWDATKERPQRYFQRRTIPRLDADVLEHATELWDLSQEIILARRFARHGRNAGACMAYGRPCAYLGICSGHDGTDSENWRVKEQVHNEIAVDGDGRDVLTNSRLSTFKTCRRKHFYQYELGIERVREEDVESLYFGTLWHFGLEAYFAALINLNTKGPENDHSNSGVPANAVGIANELGSNTEAIAF